VTQPETHGHPLLQQQQQQQRQVVRWVHQSPCWASQQVVLATAVGLLSP
jgi:hypothetical protein